MKKRIYPLLTLSLTLLTIHAHADEKSYFAPAILKNCADQNQRVLCDYDNTFVKWKSAVGVGEWIDGDYHFSYATAQLNSNNQWIISYKYASKTGRSSIELRTGYEYIRPDTSMPNAKWIAGNGDNNELTCEMNSNPNVTNCPFMHTPWANDLSNITYLKPAAFKKSARNIFQLHNSYPLIQYKGTISIKNLTDYPIFLHVDDYNKGYLTFPTTMVLPQNEMSVGEYEFDVSNIISFDIEMGEGARNTDNTASFVNTMNTAPSFIYFLHVGGKDFMAYETATIAGNQILVTIQ